MMRFWIGIEILYQNTCQQILESPLLEATFFSPEIGLYWYLKISRFYADFRSEGIIQKKPIKKR
jgi:hypothetical protein